MSKPVIEALFGTGAKSKVVQWLYVQSNDVKPLGARALAREAGVAYGSINKTLYELVDSQLVVREETDHGPAYRAPFEDVRLKGLFLVIRQDSDIVGHLKRALKPFKEAGYAGVFGSFAAGKTRKDSDIDVLILESQDIDRFAVMTALSKVSDKVGREVSPQFYSQEEFREKVAIGEPVVADILANPRIDLKGELAWLT